MSISSKYPSVRPTKVINLSKETLLNSSVEYSRGGVGTYVDENGLIVSAAPDQPRFNHDPETLEYKGLLVEEARTNLLTHSQNFSAAPWVLTGSTLTPNSTTAPDSTVTAFTLREDSSNGGHYISYPIAQSLNRTFSIYAKLASGSRTLLINNGGRRSAFTLSGSGSVVTEGGTGTTGSASITQLPNGWYRCGVTLSGGVVQTNQVVVGLSQATAITFGSSYTGDNTSGIYVWGAQLETGSFATSYIPTTTSVVTRLADSFSVPLPGSVVKSGRVGFTSEQSLNTYAPSFVLKDSASPAKPYVLELGSANSAPVASVVYNSVRQGTISIPALPATAPSLKSTLSFNFEPTTGAVEISSTASDDADSHVLALPAELSRPVPSDQTLDLLEVSGGGGSINLKEIYLWEAALSTDQLASVSGELKSIGQPVEFSTGVNENSDYADAGARPTLDLRFAERKDLFDDTTEQDLIDFSRGSIGTYTDANGTIQTAAADEPRFDHDPDTLESLGLLVEEERTNSAIYSSNLDTWTPSSAFVAPNYGLAPDGSFTAGLYTESGTNGHSVRRSVSLVDGTTYTLSCFFKNVNRRYAALSTVNFNNFSATFDLVLGTTVATSPAMSSITAVGNNWYKCSITFTANTTTTSTISIGSNNSNNGLSQSYVLDGTPNLLVWGAQLEAGSFPTSYIPTPATFTSRSTTATYYDANGVIQTAGVNVARDNAYFPDENGVMRPAGLLLEAAGTNLVTYSEQFDNAAWAKGRATISANATTAPDGTSTADKLVEDTSTGIHSISSPFIAQNNSVGSIFLKPAGRTRVQITNFGDPNTAIFDLTGLGTVVSGPGSIQLFPNGWYRCSVKTGSFISYAYYGINLISSGTTASYLGDGTSGVFLWGAQVETGSYPTSYIPTTSSTVTRAADVSSSSTVTRSADVAQITGANFSSWYNTNAGTIVSTLRDASPSSGFGIVWGFGGGGSNRIELRQRSAQTHRGFYINGQNISVSPLVYIKPNNQVFYSVGVAIDQYGADYAAEGVLVPGNTFTGAAMPTIPSFSLMGASHLGSKTISRLTYWPARLPDSTLQVLTNQAISTWDLVFDSSLSSNGTCAVITASTCTYTIDWGDGTPVETINATGTFTVTHRYTFPQTYKAKIEVLSGAFRPFYNNSGYADQLVEIGPSPDGWTNTSISGFGENLQNAWYGANNLRVVDRELNTSSITNFYAAWYGCTSLTSFPLLDTSSGTNFSQAWRICTSLTSFPANFFDSWTATPANNCFVNAWDGCTSLTATSVENILNSIDTSGRSAPASGVDITIDYNASSGTPNVATAVTNLKNRGWTITLNGTLQ